MSSVNVSGQAYGFLAITPIEEDELQGLRSYIESLGATRPFERVAGTHMARLVIVEDFNHKPSYKQRKQDHLKLPMLCFSSNFDGDLDGYLDRLSAGLAGETPEIWGRCIGGPKDPDDLKAYLKHNQIDCGLFYAAYGSATVEQVRSSLDQRERMIAFATRAQGMQPAELQRAFVTEFAS
ncbi:MAG: hypothetical protein ACR2LK_03225 [Solirubrobacteraceae bacterium]